jgi:DNA-binding CsgD family transcriptional regulator/tetratricopeptide (TPR) repeat protein
MLETLREFCLEELAAHGELPGRRAAHAWYFVTIAEQAGDMLTSPEQGDWLDLLEAAHGDLRAALVWTEENGRSDMMLRIGTAIWWFWAIRGHWAEGRRWLSRGIEREQKASSLRAQACFGLGSIMSLQGDLEESITFASEALSTFSVLDDQSRTAQAHLLLGRTSRRQGNIAVARHHFDEAHAMFRELRDERWIASALHNLGLIAYDDGQYADAITYLKESLEIWKHLGYEWGLASCIPGHLGDIARVQHDEHQALSFYLEALVRNRNQGDRSEIAGLLVGIASVAARRDAPTAAYLLGSASAVREMLQAHLISREAEDVRVATTLIRTTLGNAEFVHAFEEGATAELSAVLVEAEQLVARFMTVLEPEPVAADIDLSVRELGVLRLVAEGLTDKEIAFELGISRRTVSKHIELILRQMEVPSRTAAVTKATRRNVLS